MSQQEEEPSRYTRTLVVKPALTQMYDQLLPTSKSLETACKHHCTGDQRPVTWVYLDLGISQTDYRRKATENSTTSARKSNPTELQLHRVVRARSVCTKGGYHDIHTPTIFLSEMPWPLNVSRQPLPAPSFVRPSVHLRRTCLNNLAGRHYAGAEKSPAWPSFINFYSLVLPRLTLASSPLHRRSAVAPCGNHTNLSCPKHIPVNTSTHFSTGHH